MANGVIPGGLRQRAVQLALQQQRPTDMSAMMAPGSIAGQVAAGTAMSPLSLRTMALRGATRPRTQAEVLKAYGLGAPSKLPQADVAAPTSAGIADTVASYLPTAGTPEMAGLGAAGREILKYSGWQDQPYTLGQILGAGAEKGLEAMKARQDAMTAAAEKKAAAERQAKLDRLNELKTLADLGKRNLQNISGVGLVDVTDPENPKVVVASKGTKKESLRTVPGVGVVDFSDPENPKTLMKSSSSHRYKNLGPYYLQGNYIGEGTLDSHEGKRYIEKPDGTKEPIPEKAIPVTESMSGKGIPEFNAFKKIREELKSDEISMRNYARYLGNIEKAEVGVSRIADDFSSYMKTLLSSKSKTYNLTESELAKRLAEGQIQGLLGAARIETVGGGVMTEQDALRVIKNLGGDVTLLQNPEVVKEQISRLFGEKYGRYQDNLETYNNAVNQLYSGRGYKRKDAIEVDMRLFSPTILSELGIGAETPVVDQDALNAALAEY